MHTEQFRAGPQTPRKPFDNRHPINDLVTELRDDWGLDIAPRDVLDSPAARKEAPGNHLYERLQYLHYKARPSLDEVIEDFRLELSQRQRYLSSQKRTKLLFERLDELWWMTRNRIEPSPFQTAPSTPTTGKVPVNNGEASSMPPSPLTRKSTDALPNSTYRSETWSSTNYSHATEISLWSKGVTANTSFATTVSVTQGKVQASQGTGSESVFGSPRESQEVLSRSEHRKRVDPPKPMHESGTLSSPLSKRRKSDECETVQTPDADRRLSNEANMTEGKRKTPNRHFRISELPGIGFGDRYKEHATDESVPFFVSYERARLKQDAGAPLEDVDATISDQEARKLFKTRRDFQHSCADVWNTDLENGVSGKGCALEDSSLTMSGTIKFSERRNDGPLFQLELHPVRKDTQSSRVERRFGKHRFLSMKIRSSKQNLPNYIRGSEERSQLQTAFSEWLKTPKSLLGRTWHAFHIEKVEKCRRQKEPTDDQVVLFFATQGIGITEPLSIFQFIDWMIPFEENAKQPVCKAWTRISLSVKKTTPTISFEPDQVTFVPDILATGESECTRFDDCQFEDRPRKAIDAKEVMSDGCARISVGAAREVCGILGVTHLPAAFQARINGCKGMWYVSAPYETADPEHLTIWIEVVDSQVKIKPRPSDLDPNTCEPGRWSFDVVGWTKPPKFSDLHRDFLPVLEDRGVPRRAILDIISESMDEDLQEMRESLDDPARLAVWRSQKFEWTDRNRLDNPGLPRAPSARLQLLLDKAGYMLRDNLIAAEAFVNLMEFYFQRIRSDLHFKCPQSTILIGVSDSKGILEPGEVHLSLSQPIVDESANASMTMFAGKNILVARHPTLRGSDMQKVRCVSHPELAHLKDVLVMSTRGQIPLAAKLQGGDYDGDKFWVCADERLVDPFQNAPVLEQSGLETFGIKQETRRLIDIVDEERFGTDDHVQVWRDIAMRFACREKQLPFVTNDLYDILYNQSPWSPGATLLADLHDLIIDDDKNGYIFGPKEYQAIRQKHNDILTAKEKRAFQENLKTASLQYDLRAQRKQSLLDLVRKPRRKKQEALNNIVDDVLFNIINPRIKSHLEWLQQEVVVPAQRIDRDSDLQFAIDELRSIAPRFDIDIEAEIRALKKSLREAYSQFTALWQIPYGREARSGDEVDAKVRECIFKYEAIPPVSDNPIWHLSSGETAPTLWARFKLAVTSREYPRKWSFIFNVALDTACYVKALSVKGKANTERIEAIKKPKKPRDWAQVGAADVAQDDIDDFGEDFDEDLFDGLQ